MIWLLCIPLNTLTWYIWQEDQRHKVKRVEWGKKTKRHRKYSIQRMRIKMKSGNHFWNYIIIYMIKISFCCILHMATLYCNEWIIRMTKFWIKLNIWSSSLSCSHFLSVNWWRISCFHTFVASNFVQQCFGKGPRLKRTDNPLSRFDINETRFHRVSLLSYGFDMWMELDT